MRAARAALRILTGAGFGEFGCIIVKMTLSTFIKNTENKKLNGYYIFEKLLSSDLILQNKNKC